jgi:hypothetical protein
VTIDPKLLAAYLAAEYVVYSEPMILLRIGEWSEALDALLEDAGAETAAFVTAANPGGRPADPADNALAAEALLLAQEQAGYACVVGEGRDPLGEWPAEESVLVLGMPRAEAEILGRSYEQNAIVYLERGRPPELVLLA